MSIDSVFVHKMWDDHELSKMVDGGVPFPMLSDTGGRVGRVYGVFDEAAGVEARGRFIIDPDGVVQGYEVLTPPRKIRGGLSVVWCETVIPQSEPALTS